MGLKIIIGDSHDLDTYYFLNTVVQQLDRYNMLDYLLEENAFDFTLFNKSSIEDKIKKEEYMMGDLHYQLGIDYKLPIIGTDLNIDAPKEKNIKTSFSKREARMIKVFNDYGKFNNVLMIVGDTHLRALNTVHLGKASPLYINNLTDPHTIIVRADRREIDDKELPRGTLSRTDFFRLIKDPRFIKEYRRTKKNTIFGG